jgi:hypothetical protein
MMKMGIDMGLRAIGAAALGAGALWMMSGTARERLVLGDAPQSIGALEAHVAARPDDVRETRALAQQYLDVRQPGLAIVLVEGAPELVRNDVGLEHVFARALIDEGRNGEALAVERRVADVCGAAVEAGGAPAVCDAVLVASASRRIDILRALLALGVEDARAQPEASLIAYANATREVRATLE